MAAELNMYHAQLNDYKDDIERVTRELQDTKKKCLPRYALSLRPTVAL